MSREVERGVDLIAAAPGRLVDFIERGKVKLGEGKKEEKKETNKNKQNIQNRPLFLWVELVLMW